MLFSLNLLFFKGISTENNSVNLISRGVIRGPESNPSEPAFKNVFVTPNLSHNNIAFEVSYNLEK